MKTLLFGILSCFFLFGCESKPPEVIALEKYMQPTVSGKDTTWQWTGTVVGFKDSDKEIPYVDINRDGKQDLETRRTSLHLALGDSVMGFETSCYHYKVYSKK